MPIAVKILVVVLGLSCSASLHAIIVSRTNQPMVRFGMANVSMQNAPGDFSRRRGWELGYRQPVFKNIFAETNLSIALETKQRSQLLDVTQDFYNFFFLAGVSYPKLLRFHFSLGPSYILSKTQYDFSGETKSFNSDESGWAYRFGADYAVERCCEVGVSLMFHERIDDKKQDKFYGITFQYNLPVGYQTRSATLSGTR